MALTAKYSKKIKKSRADWIFDIFMYSIAILLIVITLYPMYFVVIASFSNPAEVGLGHVILLPKGLNVKAYDHLFSFKQLWIGYRNTIFYAIFGALITLAVNIPAGFVLSRKELPGKKGLTIFFLISMFFSGGMIPTYLVIQQFNLTDTIWVMLIPFAVSAYYIIVARTFFCNSIPEDLWDAAQIDGCGTLQYFFQIVLPLSKAVIAVIGLWAAVGQWNSYFNALIYLRDENLTTLQLVLRSILINSQTTQLMPGALPNEVRQLSDLLKYASIVVSSLPIMCLYPFVQKYFNQGVMLGSVKG